MASKMFVVFVFGLLIGFAIAFAAMRVVEQRGAVATQTCVATLTQTQAMYVELQTPVHVASLATIVNASVSSVGFGCGVGVLVDKSYFQAVQSLLERANKSIYIVMYAMKYDPAEPGDPVNELLDIVVNKSRYGVDVKIVVDDVTYKDYPDTIAFLLRNNISVRLDESSGRTTHAKLVIVDNRTAVLGSHNWTESALQLNHEASVEIDCPDAVRTLLNYFDSLWAGGRTIKQ
ncbi:MAG: phospholipase D-like domain-containing protein [Ignisphaera sp.]